MPTDQQIQIVQTTFRKIVPISEKMVSAFYQRLFELDPPARALFKGSMKDQMRKFIQMLAVVVSGLNNITEIEPGVANMGKRHVFYGVAEAHYKTVGEALLWSLSVSLGADFTDEVKDAWDSVYQMLADMAIAGSTADRG